MHSGGVITTIGTTESAVFIPEVWADGVIEAVESNLVMANLVNREYDGAIAQFGDTVRVPNVSNLAANNKFAGTAVTVQAPTESDKTIVINKHKECSFYVEDIASIQSKANLREIYTKKAGYAIAAAIDGDLLALYSGLSQNSGNGGAVMDADDILTAVKVLDQADAPATDRSLVVCPSQKAALLKIKEFIRSDYVGNTNALPTGMLGDIYGFKVFNTNQVVLTEETKAHCLAFHKDAFALAVQLQPRVQAQYKQEYLAWLVTVDVLYGVAEMRDAFAIDLIMQDS